MTGGAGFIGSALVKALIDEGGAVRVLDDVSRGSARRLDGVLSAVDIYQADVRDREAVREAVRGIDVVCHLAYVNGTRHFYERPEVVLEVAVKGMMNVLDACAEHGVRELLTVSSSEVYQSPPRIPTDENVPLAVPDPWNPRYSYGGGKIISELLTINYGRRGFTRALIVRPHNVYGPDMGDDHVIPQLTRRLRGLADSSDPVKLSVQGDGRETRAFAYIDDVIDGIMRVLGSGEHLGIYNVGTEDEVTIASLASEIGRIVGRTVELIPSERPAGSPSRRCPDISRLRALGFHPRVSLRDGLTRTVPWYLAAPDKAGDLLDRDEHALR